MRAPSIAVTLAGTAPSPLHEGNLHRARLTVDLRGVEWQRLVHARHNRFQLGRTNDCSQAKYYDNCYDFIVTRSVTVTGVERISDSRAVVSLWAGRGVDLQGGGLWLRFDHEAYNGRPHQLGWLTVPVIAPDGENPVEPGETTPQFEFQAEQQQAEPGETQYQAEAAQTQQQQTEPEQQQHQAEAAQTQQQDDPAETGQQQTDPGQTAQQQTDSGQTAQQQQTDSGQTAQQQQADSGQTAQQSGAPGTDAGRRECVAAAGPADYRRVDAEPYRTGAPWHLAGSGGCDGGEFRYSYPRGAADSDGDTVEDSAQASWDFPDVAGPSNCRIEAYIPDGHATASVHYHVYHDDPMTPGERAYVGSLALDQSLQTGWTTLGTVTVGGLVAIYLVNDAANGHAPVIDDAGPAHNRIAADAVRLTCNYDNSQDALPV